MYKTMYNEYEAYNQEGGDFSDKIYKILAPIVKAKIKEGYNSIEIEQIIYDNVSLICIFERTKRTMKSMKSMKKIRKEPK